MATSFNPYFDFVFLAPMRRSAASRRTCLSKGMMSRGLDERGPVGFESASPRPERVHDLSHQGPQAWGTWEDQQYE